MENKLKIKHIIFLIFIFFTEGCAKNIVSSPNYYYLDTKECQLAIPLRFHLQGTFDKNSFKFHSKGDNNAAKLARFQDILITNADNYTEKSIKLLASENDNKLVEEKNFKFFKFLHYENPGALKKEHNYYLINKSFIFVYMNGNEKEINYIIKHCLKSKGK